MALSFRTRTGWDGGDSAGPEAFHGRDHSIFRLDSRVEARGDGSTVDQNGAGHIPPFPHPLFVPVNPVLHGEGPKEEMISHRNRLLYPIQCKNDCSLIHTGPCSAATEHR
jgi:hypothetical protein